MATEVENKLERIFEDALCAMFFVDNKGVIRYANKKYAQMCRTTKEILLGKSIERVCKNEFIHVLRTGEAEFGKILDVNGRLTVVNRIPMKEDGKIIGAVGLALCDNLSQFKGLLKRIEGLEKNIESYKQQLKEAYSSRYTLSNIVGKSKAIQIVKKLSVEASKYPFSVLITGESGTGKELFAHAIHHLSDRRRHNFVRINCAAIPRDLLEAELFGYEAGAFSGAGRNGKPGKIELAHKGTLFLDEISELPFVMQAKLLRVIQEKELERVGGRKLRLVDFRLITATNRNLEKMIKKKEFREDLYYRLNVIQIHIPPLRERPEDLLPTSEHILKNLCRDQQIPEKEISKQALEVFLDYQWPGNVRELSNVLQYAMIYARNSVIGVDNLPDSVRTFSSENTIGFDRNYFRNIVESAEKKALCYLIRMAGYNVNGAAKMIGVHRTALYKKLKKYGLRVNGSNGFITEHRIRNRPGHLDHISDEKVLFSQETAFLENILHSVE